ncbi:MAG TPA: VWA domain-containing protein [Pyrinomonadaceae bacterium]|nr:VWA domain-containing protein [Pyrinomonadaceae bacterium]
MSYSKISISKLSIAVGLTLAVCLAAAGQAGRRPTNSRERMTMLNVVAAREDGSRVPITSKDLALYDDGIEQNIQNLTPDTGPARIVLLFDNSLSLRTDIPRLASVAREFAYEIYDGDQLLIAGFDERAEQLSADWTDKTKEVEDAVALLRKKGNPHLFDAINDVIEVALRPLTGSNRKRVIVLVGDGLDRGSNTKFKDLLNELQKSDITVYALQIPDRTGGAHRRDQPKPTQVVQQLVEGTGGRILPLDKPAESAKIICDELRQNRYLLSYAPTALPYSQARRLLIVGNPGIQVRYKSAQPPTHRQ